MMRSRTFTAGTSRTIVAVLDAGDDVMTELQALAARESLSAASFTAIGAVSEATLGWYDLTTQAYQAIGVPTQAEVLSLVGDIARGPEGRPAVHAHAVLGLRDGTTRGGHLLQATVRPVLEVSLTESPGRLSKTFRPEFGLALIDLGDKPLT
jgi:predicted DNA-binding protein with PD1-like motif